MRICMASSGDIKNPLTWSGTPLSIYTALNAYPGNEVTTIDLSDYHNPISIKSNALRFCDFAESFKQKSFVSKLGPAAMNPLNSKLLSKHCSSEEYDVLFEFGGFQPSPNLPAYYIYTDSSHDIKLDYYEKYGTLPFGNENISLDEFKRAADFVRKIYTSAAGVFCMSNWLAESMIKTTGVSPAKVHTVYAGANWHGVVLPEYRSVKDISDKKEIHLLLTGVSYKGKGTDIAVEAVKLINAGSDKKYILHVCGIREDYPKNEFVINHGFIGKTKLLSLLSDCDLFVLPSRFDCFGIAFVEAMTFGLPCIGRNICAMPEIIDEGINGELVKSDSPEELAELILKICSDPGLFHNYSESALKKSEKFTWNKVAENIMNVIKSTN